MALLQYDMMLSQTTVCPFQRKTEHEKKMILVALLYIGR